MIALVEGSDRRKSPNEMALTVVLVSLTLIFIIAVATFQPFTVYSRAHQPILLLVALLLSPTTIGALLADPAESRAVPPGSPQMITDHLWPEVPGPEGHRPFPQPSAGRSVSRWPGGGEVP